MAHLDALIEKKLTGPTRWLIGVMTYIALSDAFAYLVTIIGYFVGVIFLIDAIIAPERTWQNCFYGLVSGVIALLPLLDDPDIGKRKVTERDWLWHDVRWSLVVVGFVILGYGARAVHAAEAVFVIFAAIAALRITRSP